MQSKVFVSIIENMKGYIYIVTEKKINANASFTTSDIFFSIYLIHLMVFKSRVREISYIMCFLLRPEEHIFLK